jgi:catechol 2,3-dioxygenase-like lactoylglutathione lyase family enzyme
VAIRLVSAFARPVWATGTVDALWTWTRALLPLVAQRAEIGITVVAVQQVGHAPPTQANHAPEGNAKQLTCNHFSGCLLRLTGVACRISELVIDAADPDRLAEFWSKVLGYVELGREDDGSIEIGPPHAGFGGPQPTLVLSRSSDPRAGKLRLHIDVNATDRDQDAELERLLALGARRADVGQTGAESWHVLADPEGNEFCLLRRRLQSL